MEEEVRRKKVNVWKVTTFLLVVFFVGFSLTSGFGITGGTVFSQVSKEEAGEKALNYINLDLESLDYSAYILRVEEEKGLYKIVFKIEGLESGELSSYVTKDGELLFPFSYDLDKPLPGFPQDPNDFRIVPLFGDDFETTTLPDGSISITPDV